MTKKIVKYQPYTQKEIEIFRKETSIEENFREAKVNNALITLRRRFLETSKNNPKMVSTTSHFTKVIRSRDIEIIVKLIRTYLKND